ncbi:hypothetical protein ACFSLT_24450 [Novosphingobium resinovorum]
MLSHPHDVRYAVGYHSILERWQQMEPMAAAIVYADPAKPLTLVIPEANLGLVAVLNKDGDACTFGEVRTFDMLNFCEVSRYIDPDRNGGQLAEDAAGMMGAIRGSCQPDIAAAIASGLVDHGMAGKAIGFDEHRVSARISAAVPHAYSDVLDFMMRVRVVKTPANWRATASWASWPTGSSPTPDRCSMKAPTGTTYRRASATSWCAMK